MDLTKDLSEEDILNMRTDISIIRRKVVKKIPSLIDIIHEISQDGNLDVRLLCQLNNNAAIKKKLNMIDEKKLSCVVMYELLELSKAYPSLGKEIVPLISSETALSVLSLVWTAVSKRKRYEGCTHVKPKTFVDCPGEQTKTSACGNWFPTATSDNHKITSFDRTFNDQQMKKFRASQTTSSDGCSEFQRRDTEGMPSSDTSTPIVSRSRPTEDSPFVDVTGRQSAYGVDTDYIHNKESAEPLPQDDYQRETNETITDDQASSEEVATTNPCQNQKESETVVTTKKTFCLSLQPPTNISQCVKNYSTKGYNPVAEVDKMMHRDDRKSDTGVEKGTKLTFGKKKVRNILAERMSALNMKDHRNTVDDQQGNTSSAQSIQLLQEHSGSSHIYGKKCECLKASVTCFKHLVNKNAIPEFKKGYDEHKDEFICKWVTVARCVTQKRDRLKDNRGCRRQYTLPDANDEPVRVCKRAFLEILGISSQNVNSAVEAKTNEIKQSAGDKQVEIVVVPNVEEIKSPVDQSGVCDNTIENSNISINNNSQAGNLPSEHTPTVLPVLEQNGSICSSTSAVGIPNTVHPRFNHNECEINSDLPENSSFSSVQQVSTHPSSLALPHTSSNCHINAVSPSLTSVTSHTANCKMSTSIFVDNDKPGSSKTKTSATVTGNVRLAGGSMTPTATCINNTHLDDSSLISSPRLNSLLQQLYQTDNELAEPLSYNNQPFANAQAPPIPTNVSTTEAALEAEAQKILTSLPQTPMMTAEEVDEIRHELAALGIKQSQGPHQPEDDQTDVTFIDNWLQINSKDDSQPIKRLVSSDKLRTVTDNVTPAQVHVIRTKLVNLDLCFNELFSFASKCTKCKRVNIYYTMDNTSDNSGIVKGLALVLCHVHSLIEIDIRDTYLGEGGRQVLSSLSCPHLRVLTLSDDHLAGCGPQLAACVTRLPLLAYLDLSHSGLTGEEMPGVLDSLAASCPQLVALQLDSDLSQAADALTCAVQAKSRLQVLDIARCKLESKHLLNIVKSTSLKIEYLHIWGNAVCTEVEMELVRLTEQRPSLRYVAMDKEQVSGDVWDRMESVLRGRGGHLYESIEGSDERKKGIAYLGKVRDECLREKT